MLRRLAVKIQICNLDLQGARLCYAICALTSIYTKISFIFSTAAMGSAMSFFRKVCDQIIDISVIIKLMNFKLQRKEKSTYQKLEEIELKIKEIETL